MKIKIFVLIMGVAAVLIVSGPTFAHHGTAAYDTKNIVTVKGTMTDASAIMSPSCSTALRRSDAITKG